MTSAGLLLSHELLTDRRRLYIYHIKIIIRSNEMLRSLVRRNLLKSRSSHTSVESRRNLFTNAENVKRDDPYAALGLTWGATTGESWNWYLSNINM